MGGENPIRVQSMTNTSTLDTENSVRQCIRIIDAGGEYVRLTAQGVREAENLRNIENRLHEQDYHTPLVADIHFNPKAAEVAAGIVEKVRINPGNFADPVKNFQPFLALCKKNNTAIRIGVNHGSLSERIMSHYGDTPEGMVESCMEFLRICAAENFPNVVISMKASNTFVMVQAVRLLVRQMDEEGMQFPLHLGVTEAGDGEDGRIKSAVGIGALLFEGIGDTIRVSLSENPEAEIPVACLLVEYTKEKENLPSCSGIQYNFTNKRETIPAGIIGGNQLPVVISDCSKTGDYSWDSELIPDFIYLGKQSSAPFFTNVGIIVDFPFFSPKENQYPLYTLKEKEEWKASEDTLQFIRLSYREADEEILSILKEKTHTVLIIESVNNHIYEQKAFISLLTNRNISNPLILQQAYKEHDWESFQVKSAGDCGSFFLDRMVDGILLEDETGVFSAKQLNACSFGILQASGRRISKTEYVSCPGCGRTLFDLQTVIKKVKAATAHLKGLKIAIMGCIVNGPGEMADADYGYVGAGKGKVSLYQGKKCMLKNIPEEAAVEELIKLITTGKL
jgi:(E)-4-hydroxy-3-methylbut-2-enyl-diphosphate synthase